MVASVFVIEHNSLGKRFSRISQIIMLLHFSVAIGDV